MSEVHKVSGHHAAAPAAHAAETVPYLALRGLGRDFGAGLAVEDVNLDIAKGEFISLIGPSGCGKTTTLRMIAGFVQPSAGVIEKDGVVIASAKRMLPPEKRGMVMIFQSYALWPHKTVAENVAFGLRLRKVADADVRRRVTEMLQAVRLDALASRYPAELSGGQQQRVALARAIVVRPAVLLLDEPLSNLDANLREEMRVEIRRLHDEFKMTTILVTHDQAEAMATSDRIAIMNKGRLEQVDRPFALYARPRTRFIASFIGRTNFLEARCNGTDVTFDGFSIARQHFDLPEQQFSGAVTFSLRPQSIGMEGRTAVEAAPSGGAALRLSATVVEAAFFGDYWEYVVRLGAGGQSLRVLSRPNETFDVGQDVVLNVDPRLMAPVL
ncbi:MAG: Fe3/ABC transporter ATP-binding protein [Rhodospirillales bacterium]|nr:Fe3/ABC transporter ATP-binding protein [Rhodospirillales bacterium]